jgi:hypothetical protein
MEQMLLRGGEKTCPYGSLIEKQIGSVELAKDKIGWEAGIKKIPHQKTEIQKIIYL